MWFLLVSSQETKQFQMLYQHRTSGPVKLVKTSVALVKSLGTAPASPGCQLESQIVAFLSHRLVFLVISVVPNLLGTRDKFNGRQFSTDGGGGGGMVSG